MRLGKLSRATCHDIEIVSGGAYIRGVTCESKPSNNAGNSMLPKRVTPQCRLGRDIDDTLRGDLG